MRTFSRRAAMTAAAGTTAALALGGQAVSAASVEALLPTGRQYRITSGKQSLTVAEIGAELRSWTVDGRAILAGHPDNSMGDSHMGKILLPWSDRIAGGKYKFEGVDYETPITEHWSGCAIHGLAIFQPWSLVKQETGRLVLGSVLYPQYGYPFLLKFQTEYLLTKTGLRVTLTATNAGDKPAPFGSGYHPYFKADPLVDNAKLTIAASTYLINDDKGVPTGRAPVAGTPNDFRTAKVIGPAQVDLAYTDLIHTSAESTLAELETPDGHKIQLWADEKNKYLLAYSDDYAEGRPARRAIALEPVTGPGNAFNSGQDLIVLKPGQTFRSTWGVRTNAL
ncbi:aldose 1-epimerase [Amycolatopsis xylanica]|uniref:Aldose 1-epimerase n=1 Tax=Amycolatopsis xylanica TaxID=589385 RepID=A0A1H3FX99_9PSEU|nr:aldose 1-epimerase family protein [Amycolatopsis xylanica]SDX95601.1 aldose 1-epimerase [Amycolatopsis xylanica]